MAYQVGKKSPKRSKPSYIYSIISVSLVLFMLGLLGLFIIHAQKLSDYFKENLEFSIILKDQVKEADIHKLQKELMAENYIRHSDYVTKEEAADKLMEEYKEDFLELLEYNPLYASIDINLKAAYANEDSLKWIEEKIIRDPVVKEVYYEKQLVSLINRNIRNIGLVIIAISILLFFIAITLIDNTIRLAMYSNRFLIKSMQMVGAKRSFIMQPFLQKGILNGFISGILATVALVAVIYYVQQQVPELALLQDWILFLAVFMLVIVTGIFISWWSTRRAVLKYLKLKLEELY